jgi:Na/Pi-cotransporter
MALASGCKFNAKETNIDKLEVMSGSSDQCAFAGEEFSKPVKINLLGPARGLMPGSKGQRKPVTEEKVLVKVRQGSDLIVSATELTTDSGGQVRFNVTAGKQIGDHYIDISPLSAPSKKATVRMITGVKIEGSKQEPAAEEYGDNPIRVTLKDGDTPLAGVPVYFAVAGAPHKDKKAKVKKKEVITDENGVAETEFKVGKATGVYKYSIEVSDPTRDFHIRKIEVKQMGMNLTGFIIVVLGGLAIFIFGMKNMSDGLQMVAGEKMKNILQLFARNRFVAVAAGALVTAMVQSSSATTVMVVGFVNAGLLNLFQSIGIVFGANIGTTITAQMIAFKLNQLALPAIIIGLLLSMLGRRQLFKGWGQAILGFGFLFYGMTIMGGELKLIKDFPTFIGFFNHFDCSPVDGRIPFGAVLGAIGIGTAMTVLIQSSSATIAIALALASSGMINFYTAVPLILGDNIGTTITAFLASLAANKRAKQTAMAHVMFNVLGCTYMVALLYIRFPGTDTPMFLHLIDKITPGNVFAETPENIVRHIAMSHTMFNVFNVILFLPLIGIIARICSFIIPIKAEEKIEVNYLDENLLSAPSVAIEQTIQSIRYMVKESWAMTKCAMEESFLPRKYSQERASKLAERENRVDEIQSEVTTYLVRLTQRDLTEPQSELIPLLMHCTNDAERIADHTENILKLSKRLLETGKPLSDDAGKELNELWETLQDEAESVIRALNNTDKAEIKVALKKENQIDILTDLYESNHVARLKEGKCNAVSGIIYIEILSELEKIGDHLSNIAERTTKMRKHHVELS